MKKKAGEFFIAMKNCFLLFIVIPFSPFTAKTQCGFYCYMGDAIDACTNTSDCAYHQNSPITLSTSADCSSVQFTIYKWNSSLSCYCTYVTMVTTNGGSWTPSTSETFLITGPAGSGASCPAAAIYVGVAAPLPVQLLEFNGQQENGTVTLQWTTTSELNNDFFTIEKSNDGKNWNEAGKIKGAGNSNAIQSYSFSDVLTENKQNKMMYYRLKQTDYNGQYTHFSPISIKPSEKNSWELTIQNNPATENFSASLYTHEATDLIFDILDLQGRLIQRKTIITEKGSNLLSADLKEMTPGIYFVKVCDQTLSLQGKFIKQ